MSEKWTKTEGWSWVDFGFRTRNKGRARQFCSEILDFWMFSDLEEGVMSISSSVFFLEWDTVVGFKGMETND